MKERVFRTGARNLRDINLSDQLDRFKVSDTLHMTIPRNPIEGLTSGVVTQPANITISVPPNETWESFLVIGNIVCSAAVAGRTGTLNTSSLLSGIVIPRARNTVDLTAGQSGTIFLDPSTGHEFVIENNVIAADTVTVFPRFLLAGDRVLFTVTNAQALDTGELVIYFRRNPA